jgi:hypothetical protein
MQGVAGITGTINQGGSFKSGGVPVANVGIVLFNNTGAPIAYTFSNNDGTFSFNNLPYGVYTLHAEMTGKTTGAVVVNLTENIATANINFIVTESAISVLGTPEPGTSELIAGNPYPNPAGETLYIDLNAPASGKAIFEITDMQGRIIRSEPKVLPGGINRVSISTGDLSKGMYMLRITAEGRKPVQRRFIR